MYHDAMGTVVEWLVANLWLPAILIAVVLMGSLVSVLGRAELPCGHKKRARRPQEVGLYARKCDVCGRRWVLEVVRAQIDGRGGKGSKPVLKCNWLTIEEFSQRMRDITGASGDEDGRGQTVDERMVRRERIEGHVTPTDDVVGRSTKAIQIEGQGVEGRRVHGHG